MLVLASSSPQRRAILGRLGVRFEVMTPDVEELEEGDPLELAAENALRKAMAVERRLAAGAGVAPEGGEDAAARVVLGVDTVVALDGRVYGKPTDEESARTMLRTLSGRRHTVVGGVAIVSTGAARRLCAQTEVLFRVLEEPLLDWYLATGEWRGRAGGYAIQGAGAALVREVSGDYENVVGLPLAAVLDAFPELLSL